MFILTMRHFVCTPWR